MASVKHKIRFVGGKPAALVDNHLVIGDLHNGIEFDMHLKGASIPSQTEKKLSIIKEIISDIKPKKLIILGDLKHNIPVTSRQEQREVPLFLKELLGIVPQIVITKGNHDGNIESLIPEGVTVTDEFIEAGVAYFHGHKTPSEELLKQDLIVCAHTHPAVMLKDIASRPRQVWIEAKIKESDARVLVVPAFDDSTKGLAVNNSEPLGPFLKKYVDMDLAELYLLDGSYLGSVADLKG